MELRWGATTHQGRVRQGNEDAFMACPNLFVVADGMGGHNAGEVASAMAVASLSAGAGQGIKSPSELELLIRSANAAIYTASTTYADQRGMGTTITAVARLNNDESESGQRFELAIANVGDSRTYLKRNNELLRVTLDHSYVQALVNEGFISIAEARVHPRRNIVTRALGIESDVEVDISVVEVQHGDRFVLCSDGLVDEADDEEIDTVLYSHETPQMAAEDLVTLANDHGGRDNTTVIVVDVIIYDATPAGGMPVTEPMSNVDEVLQCSISEDSATESAEKKRRFAVGKIAVVAGVIAVIAVTIALIVG
jgi:protein phosphatase